MKLWRLDKCWIKLDKGKNSSNQKSLKTAPKGRKRRFCAGFLKRTRLPHIYPVLVSYIAGTILLSYLYHIFLSKIWMTQICAFGYYFAFASAVFGAALIPAAAYFYNRDKSAAEKLFIFLVILMVGGAFIQRAAFDYLPTYVKQASVQNPKARVATPTELATLLWWDSTESNAYGPNYVCLHFALDLQKAAEKAGLRCYIVRAVGFSVDHYFNAFPVDNFMVFVEPQSDYIFLSFEEARYYYNSRFKERLRFEILLGGEWRELA